MNYRRFLKRFKSNSHNKFPFLTTKNDKGKKQEDKRTYISHRMHAGPKYTNHFYVERLQILN